MRRCMLAFCILLILSAFHLAPAAPIAVREMPEVHYNAVDALKGGITAWEKRMDIMESDEEDMYGSTNEAYLKNQYHNPGSDSKPGNKLGDSDPWGLSGDSEEMESDARGPDPYDMKSEDENDSVYLEDDSDDDIGNGGHGGDNGGHDGNKGGDDGSSGGFDSYDSGYDRDDDDSPANEHSAYVSTGHVGQGPESEQPTTPKIMTYTEKLLGSLGPRPRNSGTSAVGIPKRELQGAVNTEPYISDSSLPSSITQLTNILTLS